MKFEDIERLGSKFLENAMNAMDKIDTDKIGEKLGRFTAKASEKKAKIEEGFDDFVSGAQDFFEEFREKAEQVISDIEDKAIETAAKDADDFTNKAGSMSQDEIVLREEKFEKIINNIKIKYNDEYFIAVLKNFVNEQLLYKLTITDDMFLAMIKMMFDQATRENAKIEDIETVIIRKILLILGTVAIYEGVNTKKKLVEMQSIIDANKEQVNKKMVEMNVKGYEDGLGQLNHYQIEVAILESKYIGIFKYAETLLPFFDLLMNLYENENGYTVEMPFENISKAFELGVLENKDYMSILKDPEACAAYVNKFESKKTIEDIKKQPTVEAPIEASTSTYDKPFHHIVKIYNDYFEMNSFLKGSQDKNSTTSKYYMTCSPVNGNMKPEVNSEYLIHSKTGNMITYNLVGNFLARMEQVIANQGSSVVKCSEKLLDKFGKTCILIAKINDYYCSLPIVSKTDDYHQDADSFTTTLADQSIISINPFTSEALEYSLSSEIMEDILGQIKEIKEKALKQF